VLAAVRSPAPVRAVDDVAHRKMLEFIEAHAKK
jgi:hypothetical protein